jgi:hypothetical protein
MTFKGQRGPSQLRSATRARPSRGTDLKFCGSNTLLVSRAVNLHVGAPVTRHPASRSHLSEDSGLKCMLSGQSRPNVGRFK